MAAGGAKKITGGVAKEEIVEEAKEEGNKKK